MLDILDLIALIVESGRERRPQDRLSAGQRMMVVLALVVGAVVLGLLTWMGWTRLS